MKSNRSALQQEQRELYERYGSLVMRRCCGILHDDDEAKDAMQDVFMKLFNALPTIQKKGSIYSWLLSASTNHCISLLRKRRTVSFDEEFHTGDASALAPEQERQLLLREVLAKLMAPWNETTRLVVMYTYFDGYKQDEIAELTGLGESTIRKYLTKFKRLSAASGLTLEEALYG